ncbi:MAG: hypothetical protein V7603_26 [Micromonosporaceae bacterium]
MSAFVSALASGVPVHAAGMAGEEWLEVPVGWDAHRWVTARTERTVVAVAHTVASSGHLLDAVELLERDPRIQVVFTQAPDRFSNGLGDLLRDLGAVVIPWHQAIQCEFDLALAADSAGAHRLRAPCLRLPHGVMHNKLAPAALGGPASGQVVGLAAPWLTWYGRLVPASVALSHVDHRQVLARQCPQALPVARVVGDLCLDRLLASRALRQRYRRALGVADTQTLLMVSSTWGPHSLFATSRAVLGRLLAQLPQGSYAVVAALHPALWFGHGPRQVTAWLHEARRQGLGMVEPLGWRALAAAADVAIGDHGSATLYAAAAGVPVLRTPGAPESVRAGTAVAVLARLAPALAASGAALPRQLARAAAAFGPAARESVAARVTSEPGRAAPLLRTEMYRLLRLPEPVPVAEAAPVPVVRPIAVDR